MFASSTYTLQNIKDSVENALNKSVTDETVVRAVNFFLNVYQTIEARYEPQRYKNYSGAISLTSAGYALTGITDLWSDSEGFVVYQDAIRPRNILPNIKRGTTQRGYEIRADGKIYPAPSDASYTIYIEYLKTPTRFSTSSIVMTGATAALPIEMAAEEMCEDFIIKRYFKLKGQPAMEMKAEADFRKQLSAFFNQRATRVHIL